MMVLLSILIFMFENTTGILSWELCQKLCGERYPASIEPKVVDHSCVFHADMYLSISLVLLFVSGLVLNVLTSRKPVTEENH